MTDDLRAAIDGAGGLASQADLARRWHISPQRVAVMVEAHDFPEPVGQVGGRAVWAIHEADNWRNRRTRPKEDR